MVDQEQRVVARTAGTALRDRALAVLGAVAAALLIWVVAEPVLGNDLVVEQPGQPAMDLGAGAVATMSLAPALLGWGLLAVLERLTARAAVIWTVVAVVVLLLSFLPVLGVEATGGTRATLALMHLAVGAVLIPVFWRTARARAVARR